MSEIEKMYENAGIKPKYSGWLDMGDLDTQMKYIQCDTKEEWDEYVFMSRSSYSSDDKDYNKPKMEYSQFTAEKQLALIIFLANREIRISPTYISSGYYLNNFSKIKSSRNISTFENSLAQHINALWQDLTAEEKQQVKGILE